VEAVAVHLLHGLPLLRRPPAAGAAETSKECEAGSRRDAWTGSAGADTL
jgi:hypothetical protein